MALHSFTRTAWIVLENFWHIIVNCSLNAPFTQLAFFISLTMFPGISSRNLKLFIRPIARSTCILKHAIIQVIVSSFCVNWSRVLIRGILSLTPLASSISAMLKPRSAITESPGSSRPSRLLIHDPIFPPYSCDTKNTAPDGVTTITVDSGYQAHLTIRRILFIKRIRPSCNTMRFITPCACAKG